ncbi:hypothetical protein OUZ56_016366 [Daphnia magna]|uniref:Uncharacterized protein n=1 Tax=Daphnia magna TaxID=35525 RepID=A0ABR0AQI9_9CRUS|nr:hypothetical protein OUZ56_016366 [Daphnia magna]
MVSIVEPVPSDIPNIRRDMIIILGYDQAEVEHCLKYPIHCSYAQKQCDTSFDRDHISTTMLHECGEVKKVSCENHIKFLRQILLFFTLPSRFTPSTPSPL